MKEGKEKLYDDIIISNKKKMMWIYFILHNNYWFEVPW